jgi:hypothetical protein
VLNLTFSGNGPPPRGLQQALVITSGFSPTTSFMHKQHDSMGDIAPLWTMILQGMTSHDEVGSQETINYHGIYTGDIAPVGDSTIAGITQELQDYATVEDLIRAERAGRLVETITGFSSSKHETDSTIYIQGTPVLHREACVDNSHYCTAMCSVDELTVPYLTHEPPEGFREKISWGSGHVGLSSADVATPMTMIDHLPRTGDTGRLSEFLTDGYDIAQTLITAYRGAAGEQKQKAFI